jgi:hypothetical protein
MTETILPDKDFAIFREAEEEEEEEGEEEEAEEGGGCAR